MFTIIPKTRSPHNTVSALNRGCQSIFQESHKNTHLLASFQTQKISTVTKNVQFIEMFYSKKL